MLSASGPGLVRQTSARSRRLNAAIGVLTVLTVIVNAGYLAALLVPGDPAPTLVNTWLSITAQWLPVGIFWLVAVRTRFGMPEVVLAAAGITCNAAGDTFYTIAAGPSGDLPSPSLADLGYLLYYPLTLAALLVLVMRQSRSSVRPVLFDGALASLGAAAVLAVILGPIFTDATSGASLVNGAIAALYPLFDLLLITAVVAIFASPLLRIGPRWQFLVLGFLLFTGADIAYAFLTHEGAYMTGTPLDAAWTAAVASTAIWVAGVTRLEPEARPVASTRGVLPLPALAVLAGLCVLLFSTQIEVSTVALVLAAATIVLAALTVMFRHAALADLLRGQEHLVRQLQELDASKSELIHTMSHEMRTPLTSIMGYLDLVLDDDDTLSHDSRKRLQVVERNARRLHELATNMLLLARFESGDAVPSLASVDIDRMLRRVAEALRPLADSREVEVEITGDAATFVQGDELQLEQALTNVIENAVKFTPASGCVQIDVASAGGPDVVIDVSDTGMGIPEDDLPHVFDRFFRAANAQHQAVPGTGLGLAIVREIVRAHHGDVSASSVLTQGTTLRITLPVARDDESRD